MKIPSRGWALRCLQLPQACLPETSDPLHPLYSVPSSGAQAFRASLPRAQLLEDSGLPDLPGKGPRLCPLACFLWADGGPGLVLYHPALPAWPGDSLSHEFMSCAPPSPAGAWRRRWGERWGGVRRGAKYSCRQEPAGGSRASVSPRGCLCSGCQAGLSAALPPPGVGLPADQRPLCPLSSPPPWWQYPDKHPIGAEIPAQLPIPAPGGLGPASCTLSPGPAQSAQST